MDRERESGGRGSLLRRGFSLRYKEASAEERGEGAKSAHGRPQVNEYFELPTLKKRIRVGGSELSVPESLSESQKFHSFL